MLGVNTIKKLSKKGKLKLQNKLNNVSSHVRPRKIKKIIFLATMGIIISCACFSYPPSKQFILAIKSKILKYNSANYRQEIMSNNTHSPRDKITIVLLSTVVVALVKSSFIHSNIFIEVLNNTQTVTTTPSIGIEDNSSALVAGMVIFTTIFNVLATIGKTYF